MLRGYVVTLESDTGKTSKALETTKADADAAREQTRLKAEALVAAEIRVSTLENEVK